MEQRIIRCDRKEETCEEIVVNLTYENDINYLSLKKATTKQL